MKKIVIIHMGFPPEPILSSCGEPAQWFTAALDKQLNEVTIVHPAQGDDLPDLNSFDVAIVTGSWAMVTDKEDWSERTAQWIRTMVAADNPLLGVCYGHQLIAHAMGGKVDYNPNGYEQGTFAINLNDAGKKDALLGDLPAQFMAHLSHAQSVVQAPACATILGSSAKDPHQILRYGTNVLSFQFHPEFTKKIVKACLDNRNPEAKGTFSTGDELQDTPVSRKLLQEFVL